MGEPREVITLQEATEIVPFSRSTLYRVAQEGGESSPFRRIRGRWVTTRDDLMEWVRSAPRGEKFSSDPMAPARPRRTDLSSRIRERRKAMAA